MAACLQTLNNRSLHHPDLIPLCPPYLQLQTLLTHAMIDTACIVRSGEQLANLNKLNLNSYRISTIPQYPNFFRSIGLYLLAVCWICVSWFLSVQTSASYTRSSIFMRISSYIRYGNDRTEISSMATTRCCLGMYSAINLPFLHSNRFFCSPRFM